MDPTVVGRLAHRLARRLALVVVLRGLRTLHLRMERSQGNAAVLAERSSGHPAVEGVRYPSR